MIRVPFALAGALLGALACTRFGGFHVVALGGLTIAVAISVLPRLLLPPADPRGVSVGKSFLLGTVGR